MRDWFFYLDRQLRPHLAERTRAILAAAAARTFTRRYDALRATSLLALPEASERPRAVSGVMAALYRAELDPRASWIFDGAGGVPRARKWLDAFRLVAPLDAEARWREVTVHLGELLIVLTEDLPAHLDHARKILGDVCFGAGVRYARRMKRAWRLPEADMPNAPALAIEVLRTSEYLFRVNPEHWGDADAATKSGWIEGTACPWYDRPGWNGAHCGIFGQFQAGVSSEFGLRYMLSKTIPKHGGTTCRIDLKPIELRRSR